MVENTGLTGRWQTINNKPLAICDIGHNQDGIQEVLGMISKTPHQRLHFVLGLVADKNVDSVLKQLPTEAMYYFCKADIPRAMDAGALQVRAYLHNLHGSIYGSVKEAYDDALNNASDNDLVFVGGSTFVVAEIL